MKKDTKVIGMNPPQEKQPSNMPVKNPGLRAKYLEDEGRLAEAAVLYEREVKAHPTTELYYNRLMIIYRKLKDFRNELRVINAGIKAFRDVYTPSSSGIHKNIIKLSKQLNIAAGLMDKKGNSLYDPEPIAKWKKRKQVVLKRLGKS